ncbi:MAG: hypothetical protein ACPG4T_18905 [Nannocystaceae bacterium]
MDDDPLWRRGGLEFKDASGMELPVFVYSVPDLGEVERLFAGMHVTLDVRYTADRKLGYHLDVPDRKIGPWAIAIDDNQIERVAEGAQLLNLCMTMIVEEGRGSLNLVEFAEDLTHDWSGAYARAHWAFAEGDLDWARRHLEPLTAANPDTIPAAHHLLGRCHRAANDFKAAIEHYRRAARAAVHTKGHFIPLASEILSDMGVSHKKLVEGARAAYCFRTALRMRPNHPASLASLFTCYGPWREGLLCAMTRIAAVGSDDALVVTLANAAASLTGDDPAALLATAKRAARGVDLTDRPFGPAGPVLADEFFAALDGLPAAGEPERFPLPEVAASKPWWKFW